MCFGKWGLLRTGRALGAILALLLCAPSSAEQYSGERLRALVRADAESGRPAPDRWPDLSPDALRYRETHDRVTLETLLLIPRDSVGGDDRTLYDLFERQLMRRLEQFRVRLYLTPFWQDARFGVPALRLPEAIRAQGAPATIEEAQRLLHKLEAFPTYAAQAIALLRAGKAARLLPARELAEQEAAALAALAGIPASSPAAARPKGRSRNRANPAFRSPFYTPFQSMPGLAASHRARIQEAARKLIRERAIPAAKELHDVVTREYLPACPESPSLTQWPNGAEIYRELARRYTSSRLEPQELHDVGVQDVTRIREAMAVVAAQTGYEGSLGDFLADTRDNADFYCASEDDLLAAYRAGVARIEPLLPKVVRRMPRVRFRLVPVHRSGSSATYHAAAAPGREASLFVEMSRLDRRPKYEILPLLLHDGMPGHHLRAALEAESRGNGGDALAEFERTMRSDSAFAEGWALYAESLGEDMGLYADPYDRFGYLSLELKRAVRVVVDTGIHLHGWSEAAAKRYFMAETGKSERAAAIEIERCRWPGTQLAYAAGGLRFKAMRERASAALGRDFDLREFHDTLLRWGPLPLDILERKLDECLKDAACKENFGPPRA
jgi:uncharacterized protein (DUF885 family)